MPDHWVHGFNVVTNGDPVSLDDAVKHIQRAYEVIEAKETHASDAPGIRTFSIRVRSLSRVCQAVVKLISDAFDPAFAVVQKTNEICYCR